MTVDHSDTLGFVTACPYLSTEGDLHPEGPIIGAYPPACRPRGWPPARSGTILRLGEKRPRRGDMGDYVCLQCSGIEYRVSSNQYPDYPIFAQLFIINGVNTIFQRGLEV